MTDEELMKLLGQVADELILRHEQCFHGAASLAEELDEEDTSLKTLMLGSMLYAADECLPTS